MASVRNSGSASSVWSIWSWRRPTDSIRFGFLIMKCTGYDHFEMVVEGYHQYLTSWLLSIAGRVHCEKPSRQGDLQKGQPQHLWGKVDYQWLIENCKVLSETRFLRWMGRTTSCIARTCASWPSCSSTTRPSTSTLSLSFSTFSARWTGSGCLETLEQLEPWHSSDMATTLWGTFPKRKKALMETMLLVFSPCPHTRFNAFSNYSLTFNIQLNISETSPLSFSA